MFIDSWGNEYNTKEGRTSSWTSATYFYDYAENNDEYGLCSEVDVNVFYGEVGDLALVGFNKEYSHSSVVIDLIKDDEGNTIDLLIASNTGDAIDLPLSAYPYPLKSLIKINLIPAYVMIIGLNILSLLTNSFNALNNISLSISIIAISIFFSIHFLPLTSLGGYLI